MAVSVMGGKFRCPRRKLLWLMFHWSMLSLSLETYEQNVVQSMRLRFSEAVHAG